MRYLNMDIFIKQLPDLMIQAYVTVIAITGIMLGIGVLRQLLTAPKKRG